MVKSSKFDGILSTALRRAILAHLAAGKSYSELARATGVERASIQRFVDQQRSLRLDKADRLAEHLALVVKSTGRGR